MPGWRANLKLAAICWYLCGLFGVAAAFAAAITAVPATQRALNVTLALLLAATFILRAGNRVEVLQI